MGDKQVIGVFAAMGTVEDTALSSILGAHYRGYMQLVLVADNGCRERVTRKLVREKFPVPDMLAFTHMQVPILSVLASVNRPCELQCNGKSWLRPPPILLYLLFSVFCKLKKTPSCPYVGLPQQQGSCLPALARSKSPLSAAGVISLFRL